VGRGRGVLGLGGWFGCWGRGVGLGVIGAVRGGGESMRAKWGDGAKMD